MESNFTLDLSSGKRNIIKVIGVGGGGGNAANHMHKAGIKDVDFMICNTDWQALSKSNIEHRIQLGPSLTGGRGAGAKPEVGKNAAIENIEEVKKIIGAETRMVFITAGMGGGTGTGAAPIIADACMEMGILTVAIVTIPFSWEGPKRREQAIKGIEELKEKVDAMIIIANDKVKDFYGTLAMSNAFSKADDVLLTAAKGIAEIISLEGYINVDFADVETVLKNSGVAIMGTGVGQGENRAIDAAINALHCPLLNNGDIKNAQWVLLNISSGIEEISIDEVNTITEYIRRQAGSETDILFGSCFDESLTNEIRVTIIATKNDKSALEVAYKETQILDNLPPSSQSTQNTNPVNPVNLRQEPNFTQTDNLPHAQTTPVVNNAPPLPIPIVERTEPYMAPTTMFQQPILPEPVPTQQNHEEPTKKVSNNLFDEENAAHARTFEFNLENKPRNEARGTETEKPTDHSQPKNYNLNDVTSFANRLDDSRSRLAQLQNLNNIKERQTPKPISSKEIEELESVPAYLRRGAQLNNLPHSSQQDVSRLTLTESATDPNRPYIRPNNGYLHDQVD